MRRKIASLMCAVLLVLQSAAMPAAAADTVYFTSVNDTLLELSDATMPFWSGGYLYVASSVFSNKELGLYYSYNTAKNAVVVYTISRAMIFDLNGGTVMDGQGESYYPPAVVKGSVIFLPVALVSNFFGLAYTSNKVTYGYLIRVRSGSSVLSDMSFIDAGKSMMNDRYEQYQKAKTPVQSNPTTPVETPPANDTPAGGQTVYLCFRVTDADRTAALLNVLDAGGSFATFYLTEEQIRSSGDLVRRLAASGQTVGLIADTASPGTVSDQLRAANEALYAATGGKTRLCLVENGSDADRTTAADAGYCCLSARIDRSRYGLNSGNAAYVFGLVGMRKGAVSVWLSDSADAAGLRTFLLLSKEADDRLRGMTETA